MGKDKITREEAVAKFQSAKEKKRECLKQLEKSMKRIHKEHTGKEAERLHYDETSFVGKKEFFLYLCIN